MSQPPQKRFKQKTIDGIFGRLTAQHAQLSEEKRTTGPPSLIDLTSDNPIGIAVKSSTKNQTVTAVKTDNQSVRNIFGQCSYSTLPVATGRRAVDPVTTSQDTPGCSSTYPDITDSEGEESEKLPILLSESSSQNSFHTVEESVAGENPESAATPVTTANNPMESSEEFFIEDPDSVDQVVASQDLDDSRDMFNSSLSDSDLLKTAEVAEVNAKNKNVMNETLVYSEDSSTSNGDAVTDEAEGVDLCNLLTFPMKDADRMIFSNTNGHTLFMKTPVMPDVVPKPDPTEHIDVWDDIHVRMPCSPENLYPAETMTNGRPDLKPRWSVIESALSKTMCSSYDIQEAIMEYNTRYKDKWDFSNLHKLFTNMLSEEETRQFFKSTLPGMVHLALNLPRLINKGIPLLRKNTPHKLTFSQHQLACLLANAFFCTWPRRNATHKSSEYANYPTINMNGLFQTSARANRRNNRDTAIQNKLRCLVQYFTKVVNEVPKGCVTFERVVLEPSTSEQLRQSDKVLTEAHFTSQKFIEDAEGMLQADFANMRLGGGVLKTGCVQEEIQFVLHPELIVSRLFTECLSDKEVMIMRGVERYSSYSGYSDEFVCTGPYQDTSASDALGRKYRHIVAMDATRYGNYLEQFAEENLLRDFNKARCAFYTTECPPVAIATGNWGCGAFRGEHKLKALIQLMVAAECQRQVFYSVFGSAELKSELHSFYRFIRERNVTVGQLWRFMLQYRKDIVNKVKKGSALSPDILRYIRESVRLS